MPLLTLIIGLLLAGCEDPEIGMATQAGIGAVKAVTLDDVDVQCLAAAVSVQYDRQHRVAPPDNPYAERLQRLSAPYVEYAGHTFDFKVYLSPKVHAQFSHMLGGGRVGQAVAQALATRGIDFRVVEKKAGIASQDNRYIQGSAADREVLDMAGIAGTPSIIITTHDDNLNIYLTIYCRRWRPDAQIICRASLDRNIKTLHRAGADLVMSFSSLVTTTIINLLERQQMLMLTEGLNVFQLDLSPRMVDKALQDLNVRETTECSTVAVKPQDDMMSNPDPGIVLRKGDELVLIGSAEAEKKFVETYPAAEVKAA